jgi:hypothetical protein
MKSALNAQFALTGNVNKPRYFLITPPSVAGSNPRYFLITPETFSTTPGTFYCTAFSSRYESYSLQDEFQERNITGCTLFDKDQQKRGKVQAYRVHLTHQQKLYQMFVTSNTSVRHI